MSDSGMTVLQLCPFSDYLETELNRRFTVQRWFEMTEGEQTEWLVAHAASVKGVATGGHIGCPNALMERLPELGIIAINGVGFDKVDLDFARGRGVRVTSTPDVLTDDVADLALGLIISLLRDLPAADRYVRDGRWQAGDMPLGRKVSGRRFGIVGLGRIGSAIARRLEPLGPVLYTDIERKPVDFEFHPDLTALAAASDVLIVASSANAETRHLIDSAVLSALGAEGYLVNVARGSIVDEAALAEVVAAGQIAGAALDVFDNEPDVPAALIESDKVVVTPHIASATVETRTRMADLVLENLEAFAAGRSLPTALV